MEKQTIVKEAIQTEVVKEKEVDMILVPLLAYDLKGNRVGYGKGFYDRFLTNCRSGVQKVGLSYFEPLDFIEGTDSFDVMLNACINPEKIWRF
jgi:5-formyltetrahydrofolate cyclo-ligase